MGAQKKKQLPPPLPPARLALAAPYFKCSERLRAAARTSGESMSWWAVRDFARSLASFVMPSAER
eukprot:5499523-Pleurochrysis_carterae.AAC.2